LNYKEAIDYILNIPKFGVKSGLDNIKTLLNLLNNPEKDLKIIHVAGTNGKGSVCTMLSYILCENGYRTGLFTSPHLIKFNERFKINNIDIEDEELTNIFSLVKEKIDYMVNSGYNHPTFFEVAVSIAFLYYKKENVDYVILETGLGGRIDSTNIISSPLVSVITPIGYDHTHILGNTLEKIAREKAGIIKEGCETVLYYDSEEVFEVIKTECDKKKSKLYSYDKYEYKILNKNEKTIDFSINNKYYKYDRIYINTIANYQILNASIALTVIEVIKKQGIIITDKSILTGLKKFKWPGRMEYLTNNIIVDGAHNALGIRIFVKDINNLVGNQKINILFGSLKDKPYAEMIRELKKCNNINKVFLTEINCERTAKLNLLADECNKAGFTDVKVFTNVDNAIDCVNKLSLQGNMFCCIGSLYLVGYIKDRLTYIKQKEE
jgi:dihydrofolate synthase/folylpolyglutamate synthase